MVQPFPDETRARELQRGLDWGIVSALAEVHSVRPHLYHALSNWIGDECDWLRNRYGFNPKLQQAHALHLSAELISISRLLEAEKVRFASFKGPTLSILLYQDVARREYNDLDVVVHEDDVKKTEEALTKRGYRARHGDAAYRQAFVAYHGQYIFDSEHALLDLHWRPSSRGVPFPLTFDEIWDSLDAVPFGGVKIPTLSADHLGLFLAGHGTKERWKSLAWVCDFADYVRVRPQIDWVQLWKRAAERNCGRPILVACSLASQLLAAPIDRELLSIGSCDEHVQAAVQAARQRLAYPPLEDPAKEELSALELCETSRQRLELLWDTVRTRTVGDFESIPLPPALWSLYYVIRPLRIGLKALRSRKQAI